MRHQRYNHLVSIFQSASYIALAPLKHASTNNTTSQILVSYPRSQINWSHLYESVVSTQFYSATFYVLHKIQILSSTRTWHFCCKNFIFNVPALSLLSFILQFKRIKENYESQNSFGWLRDVKY